MKIEKEVGEGETFVLKVACKWKKIDWIFALFCLFLLHKKGHLPFV